MSSPDKAAPALKDVLETAAPKEAPKEAPKGVFIGIGSNGQPGVQLQGISIYEAFGLIVAMFNSMQDNIK